MSLQRVDRDLPALTVLALLPAEPVLEGEQAREVIAQFGEVSLVTALGEPLEHPALDRQGDEARCYSGDLLVDCGHAGEGQLVAGDLEFRAQVVVPVVDDMRGDSSDVV